MKKFMLTILAVIYLGTTYGATIHLHYCMDRLVNWSLREENTGKCSNCGMQKEGERPDDCCKDQHSQVKIENDQKLPEAVSEGIDVVSVVSTSSFFETFYNCPISLIKQTFRDPDPPQSAGIAIYLLNCLFVI
jgi:hypothetical protein